ncbi:signal transduction histidine kinase [Pseudoclavibacter sp. JAI123]|uniref:sensor histidine kinase n=1 Tax=Pseudoclavibacter sp. JAI123 TaxID=2723065 RepID=UPI0015CE007E|nr:histidine kinase [Pseudoclavibacter sp. JAI123]NYF11957.1 signal transduction histidine kinase [Pseudoclavibacter sp. JAI123]
MRSSPRNSAVIGALWHATPSLLVLLGALGFLAIGTWDSALFASVPGIESPVPLAALIAVQALLLWPRRFRPLPVFGAVVGIDLAILGTTAGELGIGVLAVGIASYRVVRRLPRRTALIALGLGAAATTIVGGVAMLLGSREAPLILTATLLLRILLLYILPAGIADYVLGRERLTDALREQARMAEQRQVERARGELRAERTALARELHDIAGHHLSGIIVSAQAAATLTRSDPERARAMMRGIQDDARTTLVDLRRTVGLLRSDDDDPSGGPDRPSPTPDLAGISMLVDAARERGQVVDFRVTGTPRTLGPLTEATAYRMVQESLANAARHARGARSDVSVRFDDDDEVKIVVANAPNAPAPDAFAPAAPVQPGYGLSGMAERAELVGATLKTGQTSDGGWRNELTIGGAGRGVDRDGEAS